MGGDDRNRDRHGAVYPNPKRERGVRVNAAWRIDSVIVATYNVRKGVDLKESSTSSDDWRQRIVCDPGIHHGEPCVRGTRIAVSVIVGSLADLSVEDLLREYPRLAREDIQGALDRFAAISADLAGK